MSGGARGRCRPAKTEQPGAARGAPHEVFEASMNTLWAERFAQRTQGMRRSEIRELLKLTEEPGIISFGGGLPAPVVFPIKEFEEACVRVLREHGAQALQYSTTEGY